MTKDFTDLITLATSAPEAYDGFSTRTIRIMGVDRRGNPVREVFVERRDYDWQTSRYDSGSHLYTDERRTLEGYVRLGDWTLNDDKEDQTR
jgi:hypothetical protein